MAGEENPSEKPTRSSLFPTLFRRKQGSPQGHGASVLRRFAYNLLIGIIIYGLAILLGKTGTGEEVADKGFDLLTMLESEWFSERSVRVRDVPVYFIEITPEDHKRWNDQDVTNREKLAGLVEAAYEKEADVVVLDVLLEAPATGDEILRKAFGNFTSHLRPRASTKLILPVQIDPDGQVRKNIFDDLISRYPETYWRGLAYIEATGSKALVRYWTSYRAAKTENGKQEGIWGIPALAAAMMAEKDATLSMEHKTYVFSQRIRYRLIPQTRSTLRIAMQASEFESGRDNPLPPLKGKIVVIGSNSPPLGDIHRTPVGALPGMYILGNAIHTVLHGLSAPILPKIASYLFQLFAIVVAAAAFTCYPSSRAYLITVWVYFVTLMPLGCLMYLTQGDLYNYMLPVLGMRLRMKFSKYESMYHKVKTQIFSIVGLRRN